MNNATTIFLILLGIIILAALTPVITSAARTQTLTEAFDIIGVAKTVSTQNESPLNRTETLANIRQFAESIQNQTPIQCSESPEIRAQIVQSALPQKYKNEQTIEQYRQHLETYLAKQCGLRQWLQSAEVLVDNYPQDHIPSTLFRTPTDTLLNDNKLVGCIADAQALDAAFFVPITGYKLAIRHYIRKYELSPGTAAHTDDHSKCILTALPAIPYFPPTEKEGVFIGADTATTADPATGDCSCVPMVNPATGLVDSCPNCPSAAVTTDSVTDTFASFP